MIAGDLKALDDALLVPADLVDGGHLVQDRVGVIGGDVCGHRAAVVAVPLHGADEFVEFFLGLVDGVDGLGQFTPGAFGGGVGELLRGDGVLVVDDGLVDLFLPHGHRVVEVGDVLVDTGDLVDQSRFMGGGLLRLRRRAVDDADTHAGAEQDHDRGSPTEQSRRRCVTSRRQ